jgi:hypothetical protein
MRAQRRVLKRVAAELLADQQFAQLVELFADQPVPASRLSRLGLVALTLVVTGAIPACLVAARLTGSQAFLTGILLMVPAFMLFGRCCRRFGVSVSERSESR